MPKAAVPKAAIPQPRCKNAQAGRDLVLPAAQPMKLMPGRQGDSPGDMS